MSQISNATSDDPADQPKTARAMRFFLHGGRVHMLYKEHENSENWMPEFPGIDVLVGTGPSWMIAPALAAPEEWPKMKVEVFMPYIRACDPLSTSFIQRSQVIRKKILASSKLTEDQKSQWKEYFTLTGN